MTEDGGGQVGENIASSMNTVFGDAAPSTVFSEPVEVGDSLVITAAAWERAGGFGFGTGEGSNPETGEHGGGGGGGGGGTSQGRPVAVIKVTPGGIEVRPVFDYTKIGVTVLLSFIGVWRALRR